MDEGNATVGITAFAAKALGDVVHIAQALKAPSPFGEADAQALKARVKALAAKHPLYPGLWALTDNPPARACP